MSHHREYPTSRHFAQALSEILNERIPDKHVALLAAHAAAPRATASWRELATEVGYRSADAVKLQYGTFAHRLAIKLHVTPPADGYWLDILAEVDGRDAYGHVRFRLRKAALEGAIKAGIGARVRRLQMAQPHGNALHLVQGGIRNGDLDWLKQATPRSVASFWIVPKSAAVGDRVVIYVQTVGFTALARVASPPAPRTDWPNRYGARLTDLRLLHPPIDLDSIRREVPELEWARYPRSVATPKPRIAARILDLVDRRIQRPCMTPASQPELDILSAEGELRCVDQTTRESLVQARRGQGIFREGLLRYWGSKCALTGCTTLQALRASHIKPWISSSNAERLDPFNGLLLVGTVDLLFDVGLISFTDAGRLLISSRLSPSERKLLALNANVHLQRVHKKHLPYLKWHREHRFEGVA